jgi:hypothetical protein
MLKSTPQPHMTTAVKISVNTAINQLYLSINYPVVYEHVSYRYSSTNIINNRVVNIQVQLIYSCNYWYLDSSCHMRLKCRFQHVSYCYSSTNIINNRVVNTQVQLIYSCIYWYLDSDCHRRLRCRFRIVTVWNMLKSTLQPHMTTAVKISVNTVKNQLYLSINYPVVYDIGRIVTVWNMLKSTPQPPMTITNRVVNTQVQLIYSCIYWYLDSSCHMRLKCRFQHVSYCYNSTNIINNKVIVLEY